MKAVRFSLVLTAGLLALLSGPANAVVDASASRIDGTKVALVSNYHMLGSVSSVSDIRSTDMKVASSETDGGQNTVALASGVAPNGTSSGLGGSPQIPAEPRGSVMMLALLGVLIALFRGGRVNT